MRPHRMVPERRYSDKEVQALLRRAAQLDEGGVREGAAIGIYGGIMGGLGIGAGIGIGVGVGIGALGSPTFAAIFAFASLGISFAASRGILGWVMRVAQRKNETLLDAIEARIALGRGPAAASKP